MAKQVSFIGREEELAQIDRLIRGESSERILCINGPGGIGKTRLLQEVYRQFVTGTTNLAPTTLAYIIDFDNPTFHLPQNLGRAIAKMLSQESDIFQSYLEGLLDLRQMEMAGISQKRLAQENLAVNRAFVHCFNKISAQKQIVLLFDTTDILGDKKEVWNYIAKLFPEMENCLLIIAGRNARPIGEFLQDHLSHVKIIDLSPLGAKVSELYLQQKQEQLHITLEPDLAQKLLLLAEGRPVLIDLAIEWQARNIPLTWLVDSSLSELQALSDEERQKRQQEFEYHLVHHIADGRQPIDRLTLVMSRIYPIDAAMVSNLFKNLSPDKAKELFEEAKSYVFVKVLSDGRITLHDEMRRMVNDYLWQIADPEGDRQVRDSKIAVEYFENEAKKLEVQIKEKATQQNDLGGTQELVDLEARLDLLTEQWVTHAIKSDIEKGFSVYSKAVQKARNAKKYAFAKKLEEITQPYVLLLDTGALYEFKMIHGRLLNDIGQTEESIELFKQLLIEHEGDAEREADIYNALSVSEVQIGEFNVALSYQIKCYDILKKLNKAQFLPTVLNYIGYITRLSGRWQQAIQYYRQALEMALQSGNVNTIASILNNLGYVLGMDGRYPDAIVYCNQAIDIWRNQHKEVLTAQGESTLGSIYGYKGDYDEAEAYLERAIGCFRKFEATSNLVSTYAQLGIIYLTKGTDPLNLEQLKVARDNFDKAYGMAMKNHVVKEIPKILIKSSYVYWELGQKMRARQNVNMAYEMGKEIHDLYVVFNSLVAMAEYDYSEGEYEEISDYAEILKEEYEDKGYKIPLFSGIMRRILGNVAFEKEDYETAFNSYAEGLYLIAQHGGYGKYSIHRELEAMKQKLLTLPPKTAEDWSVRFKKYWQWREPEEKYTFLVSWCDQQIVQTKLRALKG